MTSKKEKVLDPTTHDLRDPNPWLAMYLDSSIPMNDKAKQALVLDNDSRSGKWLMPFIIVWSKITIFFIHIFKFFFPRILNSRVYFVPLYLYFVRPIFSDILPEVLHSLVVIRFRLIFRSRWSKALNKRWFRIAFWQSAEKAARGRVLVDPKGSSISMVWFSGS